MRNDRRYGPLPSEGRAATRRGLTCGERRHMIVYWLLFSLCAIFALEGGRRRRGSAVPNQALVLGGVFIALMIGLRFQIGADWPNYMAHYKRVTFLSLTQVLGQGDPGYYVINWISSRLGFSIREVNLVCGAIFAVGLIAFVRTLPRPWLGMVVAVPYLVIVVAMGYSRQGVAIGLVMLALAMFTRGHLVKFAICTIAAVSFHKTAVFVLPLVALASTRSRIPTVLALGVMAAMLYYLFIDSAVDRLVYGYIETEYDSDGAAIRVAMNAIPAVIFLLNQRRFELAEAERKLWRNMSITALACIPALMLLGGSTLVDRLALYLIPLQLFVLASLPRALGSNGRENGQIVLAVIAYSAAILFTWLNFAGHTEAWVPYKLYIGR
ncbi:EpsG family protein [Sphingomonas colocasiae]|uniref:EpsG family protein n=1 Tax=Sphingomonas colocasiae TaxID=1848973 RepID=A0ABS7PQJ7_9SPHN|nr:EpsG family protein [Sphingomonas colocasiae]MBY8823610.1 EpsG family protein [Sphingomonas colocasiae]